MVFIQILQNDNNYNSLNLIFGIKSNIMNDDTGDWNISPFKELKVGR